MENHTEGYTVPEYRRQQTARHEAIHAAYHLALYGKGVILLQAKRQIEKPNHRGWCEIEPIVNFENLRIIRYGEALVALAPWCVHRVENDGATDYGTEIDCTNAWHCAFEIVGMEQEVPLVPRAIHAHQQELEPKARQLIETLLKLIEKSHKKLKPLIDALAQELIEKEEIKEDRINAIFQKCQSPRITISA